MATALADLVATSEHVASTTRRSDKVAALAELLRRLEPGEIASPWGSSSDGPARVGSVWAGPPWAASVPPAAEPTLTIRDLDEVIERIGTTVGAGSAGERQAVLADLLERATEPEATFIWRLLIGELRQGALEGVMADAVARPRRRPIDAGAPGRDVQRRPRPDRGASRSPRASAGLDAHRPRGAASGAADAGGDSSPTWPTALGRHRARLGRVEARRRPDPGAPRRRRGPRLHPQPQRHHRPPAAASSRRCAPSRSSASRARR